MSRSVPGGAAPRVSVIVPARNAQDTIRRTLDSLLAQTMMLWESIVVDDGSTDGTGAIVAGYARDDARFHVVGQPGAGLSGARNSGVGRATAEWLHFLDAGDWMAPTAFERLLAAGDADASIDAVHCGWSRVADDGTQIAESRCWQEGDLFELFAARRVFALHACLVRRSVVEEIGGFDPDFATSQDWVLWQRVARRGARFGSVPDTLAFSAPHPAWLSSDPLQLLHEPLEIITLGHRADPRVPGGKHAGGRPAHELPGAQLRYACWVAGVMIAKGKDASILLARIPRPPSPPPPIFIAESLLRAVSSSLGTPTGSWPEVWSRVEPMLARFLGALEQHVDTPGYARAVRAAVERGVAPFVTESHTLGLHAVISCEITSPITDVVVPAGAERLAANVYADGRRVGLVELPAVGGRVTATVLRDAIAAEYAWPILGCFFEREIYRAVKFVEKDGSTSAWIDGVQVADNLPADRVARLPALHDAAGWSIFVREVWSLALGGQPPAPREPENGWAVVEVGNPLAPLSVHEGRSTLVALHVGGVAMAAIPITGELGTITPALLAERLTSAVGVELCRAAVREGLLGSTWNDAHTLAQRLAGAARRSITEGHRFTVDTAVNPAPGWERLARLADPAQQATLLLARRMQRPIGGSAARCYALPRARLRAVLAVETTAGTPAVALAGSGAHALYVPSLLWHFAAHPSPRSARDERLAGAMDDRDSVPVPAPVSMADARLPILMYHRVAPEGAYARQRWRVTPAAFDEQLAALREASYYSVTLAEWQRALAAHTPLPGRPLLLTFDDGYQDFSQYAWPRLKRHGFGALALIVPGSVGRCNSWDAGGTDEPLMDWKTLHRLHAEGLQVGAHSMSHRRMTSLTPEDMFAEAVYSREVLQEELGLCTEVFAYPYGNEDPVARHMVGAAGFEFALSVRGGIARLGAPWLSLPRVEITGEDDAASVLTRINA